MISELCLWFRKTSSQHVEEVSMWKSAIKIKTIVSVNTEGLEHGANLLPLCCVQTQTRLCFLFLNMSLTGVRGGRVQQYLQRMGGFQCEDNPHVSYVCFWCLREAASACEAVFIASGVCTALGLLCVLMSVRSFIGVPPWRLRFWYFRCSRTGSKPLSWTVAASSERCTLNLTLRFWHLPDRVYPLHNIKRQRDY